MKKQLIYALSILTLVSTSCGDDNNDNGNGLYSGQDITSKASIIREVADGKKADEVSLSIDIAGKWSLYAGTSVEKIDFDVPVLTGSTKGTHQIDVNNASRHYFQLVTTQGKAILGERALAVEGLANGRDLGGFKTQDGRFVKWGKVFRSDNLYGLTDKGAAYMNNMHITSLADFRTAAERTAEPDRAISSIQNVYTLDLPDGDIRSISHTDLIKLTEEEADNFYLTINHDYVTNPEYIAQFKAYFALLQKEENLPLLFHCSAGKDRAGLAAFLFLTSLGVSEDMAMEDYLSSNESATKKYEEYLELYPVLAMFPSVKLLFFVKKAYLQTAIDQIKKDHGSIDNFLTGELGVDLNKMRDIYLY